MPDLTIPSVIKRGDNNFDFLRLLGAFLVFFGHSVLITRASGQLDWENGLAIGAAGVNIFFVISGFLVTKSWIDSGSTAVFLRKRILRIYPALIVAILSTVFVIGPLTTFFDSGDYFRSAATLDYLKNIFLVGLVDLNANVLPGVFVTNNIPLIVNASLWTIPIEAGCYLLVILFGLRNIARNRLAALYILLALLAYGAASTMNKDLQVYFQSYFDFPFSDIVRLLTYFFSGMVIYLYRESVATARKYSYLMPAVLFGSIAAGYFELASYFLLPASVILIALMKIDFPKKLTRRGDFSYGFYLFAFPVQQSVSYFFHGSLTLFQQTAISFFPIAILAVLSWHLVEKPFLKLKNIPARKSAAFSGDRDL